MGYLGNVLPENYEADLKEVVRLANEATGMSLEYREHPMPAKAARSAHYSYEFYFAAGYHSIWTPHSRTDHSDWWKIWDEHCKLVWR